MLNYKDLLRAISHKSSPPVREVKLGGGGLGRVGEGGVGGGGVLRMQSGHETGWGFRWWKSFWWDPNEGVDSGDLTMVVKESYGHTEFDIGMHNLDERPSWANGKAFGSRRKGRGGLKGVGGNWGAALGITGEKSDCGQIPEIPLTLVFCKGKWWVEVEVIELQSGEHIHKMQLTCLDRIGIKGTFLV